MDIIIKIILILVTSLFSPVKEDSPMPSPESTAKSIQNTKQNENVTNIESEDDVDVVTDRYKKMFTDSGSKIKTFVTTKTNGNVLNKLSGIINGEMLTVEIRKNNNSSKVIISLTK